MKHLTKKVHVLAAVLGFVGVAFGAFGAHGLRETVSPRMLAVWNTATLYLFVHVFAALVAGRRAPKTALLFSIGTFVFSGSLYTMVLTGYKKLGMITPIGGVLYLVAWSCLAFVFYKEEYD